MTTAAYHHGDLRATLVDAAVELVEANGIDRFSVREAARGAGVSSAAPYRHFADKAALLTAAAGRARAIFAASQEQAAADCAEPGDRFRAMGVAAVRFAVERPHLFRLVSDRRWRDAEDPATVEQEARMRQAMQGAHRAAREARGGRGVDPAVAMLAAQAIVYGLARMFLDGHLGDEGVPTEQVEDVAEAVLGVLGAGFLGR